MKAFILTALAGLPLVVFGQNSEYGDPLVPCSGPDCNFCSIVTLVQNIINWLFGFLTLVAVILLVVAGFKLVTSAGNPNAWETAKKMLTNVIIGFIIIMAAWLIVDTIMKALLAPDSGMGPWNSFSAGGKCGGIIEIGDGVREYNPPR